MSDLTIVIPYGNYHARAVMHAIESVQAQTYPCEIIVMADPDARGAGYTRNRGLEQVETSHVAFLDADDIIEPNFAAVCMGVLEHYAQSGKTDPRYVYTDWIGAHNVAYNAPDPCDAWTNKTFHLVTTVMQTEHARRIGGFDEVMQGVEDADFYVRLRLSGVCGIHVNAPLVHYREGGQRSVEARQSGAEFAAQQYMTERYGGIPIMGCCGDNAPGPVGPTNEAQEGDVLAQALWHGNRVERGRATGRMYPRTSAPKLSYVAAADVDMSPHLWKRVTSPMQATNGMILQPQYKPSGDWQSVANAIFGGGTPQPVSQPIEYKPNVPGRSKAQVIAKAQEWVKVEGGDV